MTKEQLIEFFRKYSNLSGLEINARISEITTEMWTQIDAKFALLTGEDSKMNEFLAQLRDLLDSDPNTPGYQQGLNLFQTLAARVSELNQAIAATNGSVSAINTAVTNVASDLADLLRRVGDLEGVTAVLRTDIDAVKTVADGVVGALAAIAGDLQAQMVALRAGLRGEPQPSAGN